jgi:hypothetical protein
MASVALVVYGLGGNLGNFSVFAGSLRQTLLAKYHRDHVIVKELTRRDSFFDYLVHPPFEFTHKIAELHVFSHSIGGGLFVAYHDPAVQSLRQFVSNQASAAGRRVTFDEVLNTEIGAIFTDDFTRSPYVGMRAAIRARLAPKPFVKLWGCNSAVAGWVYSDGDSMVVDPADTSETYYWRALNERNVPKPAVAQAFANYFNCPCHGASSGAHVEVRSAGHWVTSASYRAHVGRWPSGAMRHRLAPDHGSYRAYAPGGP